VNRLFAILLALVVGNPDCWCCMVHQVKGHQSSCCEASGVSAPMCPMQRSAQHGRKTAPGECPFILSQRDAAFAHVDVPVPHVTSWMIPVWEEAVWLRAETTVQPLLPFMDTGPPPKRVPAFVRHHALLL